MVYLREHKPTIPEIAPALREYLRRPGNEVGGSLHIVTDDGNVEDSSVEFCIGWAVENGDEDGAALARALRSMSRTQRSKVADWCERVDGVAP